MLMWVFLVLEQEAENGNNCSRENAGMVVPSHFTPLAAPGVVTQGLKWLLDAESPFYVRPRLSLELARWGMAFMLHANARHVTASAQLLRDLQLASRELFKDLAGEFDFGLQRRGLLMLCETEELLKEEALRREALRALGAFEDAKTPQSILAILQKLDPAGKRDALTTLASRVSYAKALMAAIDKGEVKANELPADIVRQLRAHGQKDINAKLDKVWGVSRSTPQAKLKEIAKYKKLLEAKPAKPVNLSNGRALFQRTCAQCHKLYGEGGDIGPDITGSNRNNLDYLLQNILDPNADIPNDYRTTILRTKDNRILVGVVRRTEGQSVTMATPAEVVTVAKSDVESIEPQNFSMMPEGLVLAFKQDELRDLIDYLRGTSQVPLPKE